jgi:hypothetical protein
VNNRIVVKDSEGTQHVFRGCVTFYHNNSVCRIYDPVASFSLGSFTNPISVLMEDMT